jgi:hypothetical protein
MIIENVMPVITEINEVSVNDKENDTMRRIDASIELLRRKCLKSNGIPTHVASIVVKHVNSIAMSYFLGIKVQDQRNTAAIVDTVAIERVASAVFRHTVSTGNNISVYR